MHSVLVAFTRALLSQFHFKMLMLTILPFVLSVVIWGVALWAGLQPMLDWMQAYFAANDWFRVIGNVLGSFGMDALKTVMIPLLALWLLLPLMILTALVFVGTLAMPSITKHVATRHYSDLDRYQGGSLWGSLWISASSFFVFTVLWLVTLPLHLIPPLILLVQPLLWGWLTYRVMAYDALAEHATEQEREDILRIHRWPLLMIGVITGAMGAAPTMLWLGGAITLIVFPLIAGVAIWLYVLVFVFSGLWFQHYCFDALAKYRSLKTHIAVASRPATELKDIN